MWDYHETYFYVFTDLKEEMRDEKAGYLEFFVQRHGVDEFEVELVFLVDIKKDLK